MPQDLIETKTSSLRKLFQIRVNLYFVGYAAGAFAPGGYDITGIDMYQAGHNIIRSHARAYHNYDDNYRSSQNGKIGITLNTNWNDPLDATNPEHRDARVSVT